MPDLATLAPLLILLAVFVTAANAFFALLIVPFLPYEVEAFTVFIPALTALLNLLFGFLRLMTAGLPAIGRPSRLALASTPVANCSAP